MLRLLYLRTVVALALVFAGCAGSGRWFADKGEDRVKEAPKAKPRAGALANSDQKSEPAEKRSELKESSSQALTKQADSDKQLHNSSADDSQDAFTQRNGDQRHGQMSAVNRTGGADTAGDPLAEQVQALGFDDPADSASALAALRAAPPQHRQFLLRTMQASAAVRKQREAFETSGAADRAPRQTIAGKSSSASLSSQASNGKPNRFAQMLANSSAAPVGHEPIGDHVPGSKRGRTLPDDPNVVAAIEVEPVEGPARGVKPASYSTVAQETAEDRAISIDQPSAPAMPFSIEPWQAQLQAAIATLETKLSSGKTSADRASLESRLRLLYLAADRRDEALRSRGESSPDEQEFWSKEVYGLAALFDLRKQPDMPRRAAIAAPHLREAADRLGQISGLVVKNLHFCTEVKGFGTFVPFAHDEFQPGQEVLLYCEVENFQSKLIAEKGYHTALKGRYEVFNASGGRVADKDLGLKEEHCQNQRRDFFVPYFLWIPKQVPPEKYQLKLTLEDVHGGKTAESTIEFVIKDK